MEHERRSRRQFMVLGAQVVAGAAGVGVLAGCSSDDDDSGDDAARAQIDGAMLTMWGQPFGAPDAFRRFYREATRSFKADTGATVDLEIVPWDAAPQKWDLAMSNGTVPDVGDVFYLASRVYTGRREWGPMDLSAEVEKGTFEGWGRYPEIAREVGSYQGNVYGIPWGLHVRAFVYNSKLWPEPPGDLAEFEQMARRIRDTTGAAPTQTFGEPNQSIAAIGGAWGVRTLTDDLTSSNFEDPRWEEALRWVQRMVDEGLFRKEAVTAYTSQAVERAQRLADGRLASIFGGTRSLKDEIKAIRPAAGESIQAAALPADPDAFSPFSYLGATYYCAFQNTESPAAAVAWLKHVTRPEFNKELNAIAGEIPPDPEVAKTLFNTPYDLAFVEAAANAIPIDEPSPAWSEISAIPEGPLSKLGLAVFNGEDVATALGTAHEETNAVLENYLG